MRISHLEECIDLANTLNFTKTAQNFYLTQPVLSKHISNLERELGIQIFVRDHHGVSLTEMGAMFVEDSLETIRAYNRSIDHIAKEKALRSGVLKIGFLAGFFSRFMGEILNEFHKVYPNIELELIDLEPVEILDQLDDGSIDFGLACDARERPKDIELEFHIEKLCTDTFLAALNSRNPLSKQDVLHVSDLSGYTVHLPPERIIPRMHWLLSSLLDAEDNGVNVLQDIYSLNIPVILLQSDSDICIVFSHQTHLYDGNNFVYLPIEELQDKIDFSALWRKKNAKDALDYLGELAVDVIRRRIGEPNQL